MKEATILRGIKNEHVVRLKAACVDPCAIMLEYVYFDFAPFGGSERVSSLDDFLLLTESRGLIQQFPQFHYRIAEDSARGLAYLHNLGIVHRDIKPANVLVSNQHYCTMTDPKALQKLFKEKPIICKLADFGESRSAVNQTAQLCRLATANIARGTPAYRAPELFGDSEGCTLSIQDLKAADVWALGMVFYVMINPDLKYPFQIELQKVQQGKCLSELERRITKKVKPSHSQKYNVYQVTDWYGILQLFEKCTSFQPEDRPDAKDIVHILCKARAPSCLDIPLRVSQNSAIENAAVLSASTDGTNSCAFLSLIFSHLFRKKEDNISGEDQFQRMASLAEQVIQTYPERFNSYRDLGSQYDISEAYEILRLSYVIDAELEFNELVISPNAVFSSGGRRDFMAAARQMYDSAKTKVGLYTCGGYIFTIGCKSGQYFVMDTHCISKELGGNGKGLLKVFFSTDGDNESSLWYLCDWVMKRLRVSGVRGESLQSFLEINSQRYATLISFHLHRRKIDSVSQIHVFLYPF